MGHSHDTFGATGRPDEVDSDATVLCARFKDTGDASFGNGALRHEDAVRRVP
jgi:hypothetical protein